MIYLFDVDNTVTPTRGKIDPEFEELLLSNVENVRFVTGSDPEKTRYQLGGDLWENTIVYQCCGNHVFHYGEEYYKNPWILPIEIKLFISGFLHSSGFYPKTGEHYEDRVGMCNFSIVGRRATAEQRAEYVKWDNLTNERETIAKAIREAYPEVNATIAGDTGIDIYEHGKGKEQVLNYWFDSGIYFFGDRTLPGGNDYDLAQAILKKDIGKVFQVDSWEETYSIVKELFKD